MADVLKSDARLADGLPRRTRFSNGGVMIVVDPVCHNCGNHFDSHEDRNCPIAPRDSDKQNLASRSVSLECHLKELRIVPGNRRMSYVFCTFIECAVEVPPDWFHGCRFYACTFRYELPGPPNIVVAGL